MVEAANQWQPTEEVRTLFQNQLKGVWKGIGIHSLRKIINNSGGPSSSSNLSCDEFKAVATKFGLDSSLIGNFD